MCARPVIGLQVTDRSVAHTAAVMRRKLSVRLARFLRCYGRAMHRSRPWADDVSAMLRCAGPVEGRKRAWVVLAGGGRGWECQHLAGGGANGGQLREERGGGG